MQYLNAKFPLEYVYSGAHGLMPNPAHPANPDNPAHPEGNVHAPKNQGRQSTDVLVFCFFFVFFCFFFFVS